MSVEIQWTDQDATTGEKIFIQVERFAGKWTFKRRAKRRENWQKISTPDASLWEALLEAIERRYQRREGITETDLAHVRQQLAKAQQKPTFDGGTVGQDNLEPRNDADSGSVAQPKPESE